MPTKNDTPPADRIIAASFRQEDAAVVRLVRLLGEAQAELKGRIEERGVPVTQMLQAVDEAAQRAQAGLLAGMDDATAEAMATGVHLAEAVLPRPEASILFSFSDDLLRAVAAYQSTLVTSISDELRAGITGIVQLGVLAGSSTEEIAARLVREGLQAVGPFASAEQRAEVVARTEINRVSNLGTWARYQDAAQRVPGLQKRWVATRDARTRPDHAALGGVTLSMDEDFDVGGEAAAHPLDSRLSARQSARCRCRLVTIVPDE